MGPFFREGTAFQGAFFLLCLLLQFFLAELGILDLHPFSRVIRKAFSREMSSDGRGTDVFFGEKTQLDQWSETWFP